MSDEEKKAIEHIKNYPINWLIENVNESAIKIVLNLIEKQSKEIEYEKELRIRYERRYDELKESSVKKRKIKAKIEELNNKLKNSDEIEAVFIIKQQQVLQSLLEKE